MSFRDAFLADHADPEVARASWKIASVFKVALARRIAARKAKTVYQRYWEPTWAAEYYFNPRTKHSYWEKPKMLRDEDMPYSDEVSAALAAAASGAAGAGAPLSSMLGGDEVPLTRDEKLALMKKKNKKGERGGATAAVIYVLVRCGSVDFEARWRSVRRGCRFRTCACVHTQRSKIWD